MIQKIDVIDKKNINDLRFVSQSTIIITINSYMRTYFLHQWMISSSMDDREIVEGYLYYSLQTQGSEVSASQRE